MKETILQDLRRTTLEKLEEALKEALNDKTVTVVDVESAGETPASC